MSIIIDLGTQAWMARRCYYAVMQFTVWKKRISHLIALHMIAKLVSKPSKHASFELSTSTASSPVQLLHSDIMESFKVASMGNNTYVATLLDDYSRYEEVFCMKDEKKVQDALIKAIPRFQRQSGHQCQIIRTDRGKEYMGKLSEFLKRKGVIHQRSSPYTPEQNGRA
jgi:hypothetical protein